MPSGSESLASPLPSWTDRLAVRLGAGAGGCAGMIDFTDCQAAATDAASFDWLAVDWLAADWFAADWFAADWFATD